MVYFSKKCEKKTLLVDCYGRGADQRHVRFGKTEDHKTKNPPGGGSSRIKIQTKTLVFVRSDIKSDASEPGFQSKVERNIISSYVSSFVHRRRVILQRIIEC